MGFGAAKAHDCCTVFLLQDARRDCSVFALLNRLSISRLKSFKSSGLREVTRLPSTTTERSTHSAPAFFRSVFSDGQEVSFLPRTPLVSIRGQGPWQIAAMGLLALTKWSMNATACWSIRSVSGFATPPGRTSASKSVAFALDN